MASSYTFMGHPPNKPLLSRSELFASWNSLRIQQSCCYWAALALLEQGLEAHKCFQSTLMCLLPLWVPLPLTVWDWNLRRTFFSLAKYCLVLEETKKERERERENPQSEGIQTSANIPSNSLALMQNYSIKSNNIAYTHWAILSGMFFKQASTTLCHSLSLVFSQVFA